MSETTSTIVDVETSTDAVETETQEQEIAEVAKIPGTDLPTTGDAMADTLMGLLISKASAHNSQYAKLAAVDNSAEGIAQLRDDSSDPVVISYRDRVEELLAEIEEATSGIDEYIAQNLLESMSDDQREALKTEVDKLADDYKATKNLISRQTNANLADYPFPAITSKRKSGNAGASGIARPRVDLSVWKLDKGQRGSQVDFANFTKLVGHMRAEGAKSTETVALHDALRKASGVKDLTELDKAVSFTYGTDGVDFEIRATPRQK